MNSSCPAWLVALIHRLSKISKLKTLRVEFTEAVLKSGWPPYDVILRMKSLQSCYIFGADHGAEIMPDDSFRSVKTRLFPGVIALNGLEFLILRITHDGPLDNYPWQTLVAFEIVLEDECQQLPQQFLRDLSEQTKSVAESQNLRRLRITLTHKLFDVASFCSKVLDCFASANLQHLELDLGSHLELYALKIPCERLKRLTIRANWKMTSNKDYSRLTTRLATFGHLTALTLVNLRWDADVSLLDVEPPASKPSHYRRLPALHTFVQDAAESTNILQLCISDDDSKDGSASARACELRFIRRPGEASFQVDRYTGGECRDHFPVAF